MIASPADVLVTRTAVHFAGRRLPRAIGRGGVTRNKAEGDGATPFGSHRILDCLYRPDRLPRPCDWAVPIRPRDLWSDDPRAEDYNHKVRAPYYHSHEALRRPDPLYDLVLTTDWNHPDAVPGRGSAIFVHVWRGPRYPTAGCVALSRSNLLWLVARLTPGARLIVRPDPTLIAQA